MKESIDVLFQKRYDNVFPHFPREGGGEREREREREREGGREGEREKEREREGEGGREKAGAVTPTGRCETECDGAIFHGLLLSLFRSRV